MNRVPSDNQLGPEQLGTVIRHFSTQVAVEDENGEVFRCFFRQSLPTLVVGDCVVWRFEKADRGVVTGLRDRKTTLSRFGKDGSEQVLAANVDCVVAMFSAASTLSPFTIDRYLLAAQLSGIAPLILLNKVDLLDDKQLDAIDDVLCVYRDLAYPVFMVSALEPKSLKEITAYIVDRTSIVIGESGVGKSSMINAFLPNNVARVGEVSEKTGHGQHTTTGATLYHLDGGGNLIDSAGIRHFTCWHTTRDDILRGFKEFVPYIGDCKFRDCEHKHEPGCALLAAVGAGNIAALRLESYHKMVADLT